VRVARLGVLILAACAAVGCVGWGAFRCPDAATPSVEVDPVTVASLRKIRVVVRSEQEDNSREVLATCLRRTGLFGEVVESPSDWNVQLAATVVDDVAPVGILPILSAMTLGVLPQWFSYRAGFVIRLSSLPNAPQMMEFDCRYDSVVVFGWPSMLLTPFAAFATCAWRDPEESQEFADFVRVKLLEKARDLKQLAELEGGRVK
jgi:hypothetical protein